MRLPIVPAAAVLTSFLLPAAAVAQAGGTSPQAAARGSPCKAPNFDGPARCGTFEVWENRETQKGRRIALKFIVVPSTGPAVADEAVIFFSGGPGQAATASVAPVAEDLASVRDTRDLLFVDLRGTGGSNALPCKSAKPADLQSYLTGFYNPKDVERCAKELQSKADVTWYHSAPALDDVEDLRAALGYQRVDLFGISYGTRAALVYLRRHPGAVRSVLMHGTAPNDSRYPITVPRDAQLALDGVFADCAKDAACHKAFPDPARDLAESFRRLEHGPVAAQVLDAAAGRMTTVMLARDRYTEGIRALLYDASSAALVPAIVHRAAQGDFGPIAEEELAWRMRLEGDSRGMHLAVTCSEDIDFIDLKEAAEIARPTFMSDWRAVDQKAACAHWPHAKLDRSVLEPVRSDVPLLIMNGEDDPATALYHARRVVQGFPNGRIVVIPHQGHGFDGLAGLMPCYRGIVSSFIEKADAKAVDATCMDKLHREPFPTAFPGGKLVSLKPAAMARFAGTYAGDGKIEVRVAGGKLHAVFAGEDVLLLPIGPTQFRVTLSPHTRMTFREANGTVTGFVLEDGASPLENWKRL